VPEPELADAQNYLSGVFSMGSRRRTVLLSQLSTVALNELPDDYLETYRQKVRALTRKTCWQRRASISTPRTCKSWLFGDRAQIEEQAALIQPAPCAS